MVFAGMYLILVNLKSCNPPRNKHSEELAPLHTYFYELYRFSDYPNEEERLFYGYHNELEIVSIFCGQLNYKKFIRALKVLDILTDPNMGGTGGKKYANLGDAVKRRKYCDHLYSMMKKSVDINQYNQEMEQQKNNKDLKRKHWKIKKVPEYMMNIFNYFVTRQTAITLDLNRFKELQHELQTYFVTKRPSNDDEEPFDNCLNFDILNKLFPNATSYKLDFGVKVLGTTQFDYFCEMVSNLVSTTTVPVDIVEFKGLEHRKWSKMKRRRIKEMQQKYFTDQRFSVKVSAKTVSFVKDKNAVIPNYENIFIGNFHRMEVMEENEEICSWTMFISTSKDRLIVPKSVKQVTYYLDPKLYKKNEITVDKAPFNLKRKGSDSFEVKIKVGFRGKRYNAWYYHRIDFNDNVCISNRVCEEATCNHGGNHDIYYSDDIRKYDYWACKRTDGGLGVSVNRLI